MLILTTEIVPTMSIHLNDEINTDEDEDESSRDRKGFIEKSRDISRVEIRSSLNDFWANYM